MLTNSGYTHRIRTKSTLTLDTIVCRFEDHLRDEVCKNLQKIRINEDQIKYFQRCNVDPEAVKILLAMMLLPEYTSGLYYKMIFETLRIIGIMNIPNEQIINAIHALITIGYLKFEYKNSDQVYVINGRKDISGLLLNIES